MGETEGVIKFQLEHTQAALNCDVSELSAWRSILKQLQLIGQIDGRYDGYGFGNISLRSSSGFIISGTQTGELEQLTVRDYALCEAWDLKTNWVQSTGEVKPSSESLSHAAVYDVQPMANCALHVHSPEIWCASRELGIVTTDRKVPYGTLEMANEVHDKVHALSSPGIFSMGGHEDGIFTFGRTLADAGSLLIDFLVRARVLKGAGNQ